MQTHTKKTADKIPQVWDWMPIGLFFCFDSGGQLNGKINVEMFEFNFETFGYRNDGRSRRWKFKDKEDRRWQATGGWGMAGLRAYRSGRQSAS